MQHWVELPPRRVAYKLRASRLEAQTVARRRRCDACDEQRVCAPLNILAPEEGKRWFCLTSCWGYQMGVAHGERGAVQRFHVLLDRSFPRAY